MNFVYGVVVGATGMGIVVVFILRWVRKELNEILEELKK